MQNSGLHPASRNPACGVGVVANKDSRESIKEVEQADHDEHAH